MVDKTLKKIYPVLMNTKVTSSRDQKFCIDWDGSAFARTSIK